MIRLRRKLRLAMLPAAATFMLALISPGCSGFGSRSDAGGKTNHKVKDHKAYQLGVEHAGHFIENAKDESQICDMLLEVNARSTNIEAHIGSQSAMDYRQGFVDHIRASNDSLAKIFD